MSAPATAVTVSGLYAVEVPVTGSSPEQLAEGYADGLAKVFVRVSGTRQVLAREGVDDLLAGAESLLLSYQVLRGESGESRLRMTFGAVGVNRALASVEAPVWGANRPLTLAWIAVEDRGSRSLITRSRELATSVAGQTTSIWQSAFEQAAEDRGLPVVLPDAGFSGDRELLSDIWGQFVSRISTVTGETDHDALALVRVSRNGGQWRAGWVFDGMAMNAGEESVTAATPEALAQSVVNRWAELYASRYAVAAAEVGESPQVDIVLRGVTSLADYGRVNEVLEGLTPVVSAGASRVKGEQLTMRVAFSGELDQLKEYIALDPRFVALEPEQNRSAGPSPLAEARVPDASEEVDSTPNASEMLETPSSSANGAEDAEQTMFSYQPMPVDEQEAEQVFESLYQVLYYRWQPASVIGNGDGQ
ncbi:hypothetical protein BKP64_07955 [Marinobacter salinus]|uniref:DUF2066 domain-containing protein n=2 Tax=Marinobacter salinus TaxID=1874317 RepID=A0A1D9GKD9_9GAMM|nr:hypothetical protein BKP64_07955 [Marinobacter salinus]